MGPETRCALAWRRVSAHLGAVIASLGLAAAFAVGLPASAHAAPLDQGPGGPVLVITGDANAFGGFYAEILRNEGLNAFDVSDLASVTASTLGAHRVAILADTPLTTTQATMLGDWVQAGGNLIAMRPDAKLAGLLGLTDAGGTLADAYLKVDTSAAPGAGIAGATMQFHGTADRYTLSGATAVGTLYSDATTATANPAVTLRSVGSAGGHAAAFAYDLARSVVYTRQGNPSWVGQDRDGVAPIRSNDLFYGAAAGDPQPDWVDLHKVAIPQADEQQRLLANLIEEVQADSLPLPRFWYLPRGAKAAVVMTADDHGSGSNVAGRLDQEEAASPVGCSVADWECVRSTAYTYASTGLTPAQAADYEARGFEIASHINTGCADYTPSQLDTIFDDQLAAFALQFPGVPAPVTNRTHCIAWGGWVDQPRVEEDHGIRFDTNYYYWPSSWLQDQPGMFTGSGMPMRFANLDGSMLDVYQAATQMTDESGQSYPATIDALLSKALGSEGYYGAFTANMHTDSSTSPGADAIIASAHARGVPVVSAKQMLTWLDGRNGSSFGSLAFAGGKLSFTIDRAAGANGLRAMVPARSSAGALTGVKRDGNAIAYTTETIKGVEYAFVDAASGAYEASYAPEPSHLVDTTTTDFGLGDGSGGTAVTDLAGGELTLAPAVGTEFDGPGLPADWSTSTWESQGGGSGGSATTVGGSLSVSGAWAGTTASFGPSHSLELEATFGAQQFQHAGFSDTFDTSWAMFSTNNTTNQLYARTNAGGTSIDTPLPGTLVGVPHRYRVDWNASSVEYYVDGALVATHNLAVSTPMRAIASDFNAGGATLTIDWLHMSPYASPATFTSRVLDAGSAVDWDALTWNADTPAGTGVAISVRTGDTAVPDGSWSAFAPVAASGDDVAGHSRYVQYRAVLTTSDPAATPVLRDVRITYGDHTAPVTTIDSGPSGTIGTTTAQFAFSASEPGSTFACRFDSSSAGDWQPCISPKTYNALADGAHTFEVRATDDAGNTDATPATRTFTVATTGDTTGPVITLNRPYDGARYSAFADPKPDLTAAFSCSDGGSGVAPGGCTAKVGTVDVADGGAFPRPNPGASASVARTFTVTATDNAGNTTTKSVTYRVFTFASLVEDDDPLAYYRLGDGAGASTLSASSGPQGEYKNGQQSEPFGIAGDGDSARRFTGADGYAYVNGITAPRNYTLSVFFRLQDDGRDAMIVQHGGAGAVYYDGGARRLRFRPVDWDATTLSSASGAVTAGTWHHVAATFGAGTAKLYLDGALVDTGTSAKQTSGTSTFYLGYGDKAPWLNGSLDEAGYFPTALSAGHVREIWLADPPPATDAVAVAPPTSAAGSEADATPAASSPAPSAGATAAAPAPAAKSVAVASAPGKSARAPRASVVKVTLKGGSLVATLRCSGRCTGKVTAVVTIGKKHVRLGSRSFTVRGTTRITLRLTKAQRRTLAGAKKRHIAVTVA